MPDPFITFNCRIITPMFLGNAIGKAELRPSSIKGALRFWWRAMHGHLASNELKKVESKIFGGVPEDERNTYKIGRSKVSVQILKRPDKMPIYGLPSEFGWTTMYANTYKNVRGQLVERREYNFDIIKFLAYGAEKREYYPIETEFSFSLKFEEPALKNELIHAVLLMSTFGGLGAKSRNGFGRFSFTIEGNDEIPNLNALLNTLKTGTRSEYTSFSDDIQLHQLNSALGRTSEWNQVVSDLGRKYKISKELLGDKPYDYDKRVIIAAPIGRIQYRHAKTYFFGVTKQSDEYAGYLLFLPYHFLAKSNNIQGVNDNEDNYNTINSEFINAFTGMTKII